MNARYPASSTGMWGPVKRTHVVAAFAATLGVIAGAAGAAAWDVSDSDTRLVYSPAAINIDRLAEEQSRLDASGAASGVSGGDLISQFGHGFVDVESLEASIGGLPPAVVVADSAAAAVAEHDNAIAGSGVVVDVASLEASIGPLTPEMDPAAAAAEHDNAITGSGVVVDIASLEALLGSYDLPMGGGFSEAAIAEHDNALAGNGIVDDTGR